MTFAKDQRWKENTNEMKSEGMFVLQRPAPSIKANEKRAEAKKATKPKKPENLPKKASPENSAPQSAFFDPQLERKKTDRRERGLQFVEPGRYIQQATRMKRKELMKQVQSIMLSKEQDSLIKISEESVVGVMSMGKFGLLQTTNRVKVPDFEWWDLPYLQFDSQVENVNEQLIQKDKQQQQQQQTSSSSSNTDQSALNEPILLRTMDHAHLDLSTITDTYETPSTVAAVIRQEKLKPQEFVLTKKERKQKKHQDKMKLQRDMQEKIRCGLIDPPPPKIRLSNMHRVLSEKAAINPTKIEQMVREEVKKRKEEHDKQNEERKLTKEQRREKKVTKAKADAKKGCEVVLFRIADLTNPKLQFRVETNANQLLLTGRCIYIPDVGSQVSDINNTNNKQLSISNNTNNTGMVNLVVVEGGTKSINKYIHTMLHRIDWTMAHPPPSQQQLEGGLGYYIPPKLDPENNTCKLMWRGQIKKPTFHDFRTIPVSNVDEARKTLRQSGKESYWDLISRDIASEMIEEDLLNEGNQYDDGDSSDETSSDGDLRIKKQEFEKYRLHEGTVIFDKSGDDKGFIEIDTDDGVEPWGGNSSSPSLSVFPSGYEQSSDFAVNQTIDYSQLSCTSIEFYYGFGYYDLEAAAILAYYKQNIAPSDYQFIDCFPRNKKTITDEEPEGQTSGLNTGCHAYYNLFGRLNGISSSECYGTRDSYENEGTYEEVCRKNCTEIYGQSLRIGEIEDYSGISEERLKKLIARFGPIWAYSANRYIYYGWYTDSDTTKFLVMYREEISGQYELKLGTVSYNEGTNIDLVDFFAYPLTECTTSSIPQFSCICSKQYFSGECICPTTPEGLINIATNKCSCIAEDLRLPCKTCKGSSTDDIDCICPTTPEELKNIQKTQCDCVPNDLRDGCKATGKDQAELVNIALSLIA
ncbi:MAG: putative U4/U6 small nuclear ribonucleoprotein Prp3, partial [Streblomastix strix]